MNTCDTCKWWGDKLHPHSTIQHECRNPNLHKPETVDTMDHESYYGISTGPKFGCIHHESQ